MSKILVVGRATIDFNPIDSNCTLDQSTTFKKYVGGSAANTAIGLQRLGVKTSVMTSISNDQFGVFVKNYLNKEGIDTDAIVVDPVAKIGLTFTEMISPTESSILMYRNQVADLQISIEDVDAAYVKEFDKVLISGTTLSSNKSRTTTLKIVEICKDNNIPIIFDLDYRPYSWNNDLEIDLYMRIVAEQSEIIVGSKEEFKLMNSICNGKTDYKIANFFLKKKAKHIIIKNGKDGSNYYSKQKNYKISIFPTKVLKSFGGGDAYMSAFIASIEDNQDISQALFNATAHAAMLVSSHSCSEALATFEELNQYIVESNIKKEDVIKEII